MDVSGHTKTFACWVWVWDMAFIPTRHTYWNLPAALSALKRCTAFRHRDAPPPSAARYDRLIHVDRIENWTPRLKVCYID